MGKIFLNYTHKIQLSQLAANLAEMFLGSYSIRYLFLRLDRKIFATAGQSFCTRPYWKMNKYFFSETNGLIEHGNMIRCKKIDLIIELSLQSFHFFMWFRNPCRRMLKQKNVYDWKQVFLTTCNFSCNQISSQSRNHNQSTVPPVQNQ